MLLLQSIIEIVCSMELGHRAGLAHYAPELVEQGIQNRSSHRWSHWAASIKKTGPDRGSMHNVTRMFSQGM